MDPRSSNPYCARVNCIREIQRKKWENTCKWEGGWRAKISPSIFVTL